jgi:2-polyprenyl-3-methyl-5-hydroxy-6-metoxy-1,4-benzoquinol methylase
MDQEKHWNTIAHSYDDEIFDVFKNDRKKILPEYFQKHANKNHRAIDFGCGVGKAFPYLSPVFKEVSAIDISSACLSIARENKYTNIQYDCLDLAEENLVFPSANFAFCCNVIMLPEVKKNRTMIRNIYFSLKPKGTAVIVVPSFESVFFSSWRLIQLYEKEGVSPDEIPSNEFDYFNRSKLDIIQGLINLNGVPTKHYSKPELEILFRDAGLTVTGIEKVEYDWHTEICPPPTKMDGPYPWDWLVECRKDK